MSEADAIWRETLQGDELLATRPSYRFDPEFYSRSYPDVRGNPAQLREHYRRHGSSEGRFPNAFRRLRAAAPGIGRRIRRLIVDERLLKAMAAEKLETTELVFELIRAGHGSAVSNFSVAHYFAANPDVAKAGVDALEHYLLHGYQEGRPTLENLRRSQFLGEIPYRSDLPTCVIAVHELSHTGAPHVGRDLAREAAQTHNVIVAALRGGPLLDDMRKTACAVVVTSNPRVDFDYFRGEVFGRIDTAICNSVEAFPFVPMFVAREIPFAAYVHEYTWYTFPTYKSMHTALFADLLIFSSEHVRDSWVPLLEDVEFDQDRDLEIIPQRDLVVGSVDAGTVSRARDRLSALIGHDCSDKRVVCGAGHAQWRKGTDLFVMTAQIARQRDPDTIFVWVGGGINVEDTQFGAWMTHHLTQAGAGRPDGNLYVLPAGDHYRDVLAASDAMLLSSRLDPLPNVVFDAVEVGCSIVMFQGASGFTDSLYEDFDQLHVVEYANPEAAASTLLNLPRKASSTRGTTAVSQRPLFDTIMSRLESSLRARRHFIVGPTELDVPVLFSGSDSDRGNRTREREKLFSARRRHLWRDAAEVGRQLRESNNWVHRHCTVAEYDLVDASQLPDYSLHLHAFYVGGLKREFQSHAAYRFATRIVVTTDTDDKRAAIQLSLAAAGLDGEVLVVPNRGRDVLPFLDLFRPGGLGSVDEIWGHIHQKRSLTSTAGGDIWRTFLTSILLGSQDRVSIAPLLAADKDTGLVAALDPFFGQWNASRQLLPIVEGQLSGPLPRNPMVYPMGNMFWVRGSVVLAMNDLFKEDFPWPNEPIPNDGTEFHLVERLWPAVAAQCDLGSVFVSKPNQPRRI